MHLMVNPEYSQHSQTNHEPEISVPEPPQDPIPARQQFSLLMREHHRDLQVYTRAIVKDHHAAQDIVQDALVVAYGKFDQYDADLDFGKWLRGIIRHKCLDWFRKQKRTPIADTEMVDLELDLAAWQAARDDGKDPMLESLVDCIAQLPEGLKDVVIEFYLQEQSGAETAERLEISAASVRKRLERARSQLYTCLTSKSSRHH